MNETELLDSLHDAQILAIKQDGRRVIIEINYVAEWEPQEEKGHYRLVYAPAGLIFKEAEDDVSLRGASFCDEAIPRCERGDCFAPLAMTVDKFLSRSVFLRRLS